MKPKIALLTQHGKEELLAPLLEPALSGTLFRVEGFDTDTLGTFTREVPRRGTQLEAAARKAQLALELSDADWGLGSEGAFHLDPYLSLLHWNTEMLVLIERATGHRITAVAHAKAQVGGFTASKWPEVEAHLGRLAFPQHALVVRSGGAEAAEGSVIARGISHLDTLHEVWRSAQADPKHGGSIYLENDLRAHLNPTRQAVIRSAGEDLARRLAHHCPACGSRGFGPARAEPGATCQDCGEPTRVPMGDWWSCTACQHQVLKPRPIQVVDPQRCDVCNP